MDSDWTVLWTPRARTSYFTVLDYLHEDWTAKEIEQFINRVELVLKAIRKSPKLFPASKFNKKVRKAFIDKNNSLFYSANSYQNQITVLTFYDNRQNHQNFKI
ncbi:MAG: hypothetical protein A2066_07355 [Bacteroidetes bacterium GWB2_41_8]|nr:MAG: hypothetical protein A2066_07355 [Bacteroidetes bacterium GWB2_41_8]